jgi:hypothetical protein
MNLVPCFIFFFLSLIEWKEIMKNLLVVSAAVSCALSNTGCTPKLGGNDYSVKGAGEISQTIVT